MYILSLCLTSWLSALTMQTSFNRNDQDIESIYNYHIPDGTTSVSFQYNLISNISAGPSTCFKNLPDLQYVYLDDNLISDIEDYAWVGVPSVRHIDLDSNKLTIIRRKMFFGLWNLEFLDFWRNEIHTIECMSFESNADLTQLWLYENDLQNIPKSMFDLENHPQNIHELRISGNPLSCDEMMCWLKLLDWITVVDLSLGPSMTATCASPVALNGMTLNSLTTQDLKCDTQGQHRKSTYNLLKAFSSPIWFLWCYLRMSERCLFKCTLSGVNGHM